MDDNDEITIRNTNPAYTRQRQLEEDAKSWRNTKNLGIGAATVLSSIGLGIGGGELGSIIDGHKSLPDYKESAEEVAAKVIIDKRYPKQPTGKYDTSSDEEAFKAFQEQKIAKSDEQIIKLAQNVIQEGQKSQRDKDMADYYSERDKENERRAKEAEQIAAFNEQHDTAEKSGRAIGAAAPTLLVAGSLAGGWAARKKYEKEAAEQHRSVMTL